VENVLIVIERERERKEIFFIKKNPTVCNNV
jgi:hypothetical protein